MRAGEIKNEVDRLGSDVWGVDCLDAVAIYIWLHIWVTRL